MDEEKNTKKHRTIYDNVKVPVAFLDVLILGGIIAIAVLLIVAYFC